MDAKELQEMIGAGPPDGNKLSVKRSTISMPWGLYADAMEAILAENYSSLSDYVQGLIRDDKLRREQAKTAQTAVQIAIPQPPPQSKIGFEKKFTPHGILAAAGALLPYTLQGFPSA